MNVQDEVALLRREEKVLSASVRAREAVALELAERRVERLQRGDVSRAGLRDGRAADRGVERCPVRLDLGVFGNRLSSWTRSA
jgi:hypothetical protein